MMFVRNGDNGYQVPDRAKRIPAVLPENLATCTFLPLGSSQWTLELPVSVLGAFGPLRYLRRYFRSA